MGPQNIDMSLIREAIKRRMGGGGMPVGGQTSAPAGPSMTGGAPTQTPQVGQPQATGADVGQAPKRMGSMSGAGFDDETRQISKALVKKLIQFL